MFERFTVAAREVVTRAGREADELRHTYVGTEHLLLAMVEGRDGIAGHVLRAAGVEADAVRAEIRRLTAIGNRALDDEDAAALKTIGIDLDSVLASVEESFGPDALTAAPPPARRSFLRRTLGPGLTRRAKKVLELALREALHLKHDYIGTEHLLLGLIREHSGMAVTILTRAGVSLDDLRSATIARLAEAA